MSDFEVGQEVHVKDTAALCYIDAVVLAFEKSKRKGKVVMIDASYDPPAVKVCAFDSTEWDMFEMDQLERIEDSR